ncbi:tetratricopeptide repeat protein [Microbispora triticiradicis]|uniref:ATP-binding protein n=2 Tax=Microbispora TaxID=2005 RepID=A0ABY3LP37_9ACTN|nr:MULTISPECIES: tetratricopeptide repeat protein [Microbispora]TLP55115.1 ATP-binding protein [Microbispora fusca]TYB45835.1 ATP-binding protein [Microbispora tritici]
MAVTRNTISGGLFLNTVVQGHTITVQLPPEVTPALSGAPLPTQGFTGRDTELAALLDVLGPPEGPNPGDVSTGDVSTGHAGSGEGAAGTGDEPLRPRIALVTGLGGAGKTELALQAAHIARERGWFPGGVLFTDLHGYRDPYDHDHSANHGHSADHDADHGDQCGARPGRVLGGLLRALGLDTGRIPPDIQDRARLFATVLDAYAGEGRPILLVLDNASSAEQVRPLLPGTGKVLVTSRHTLDVGARVLDLGMLEPGAAVDLLARRLRLARGDADTRVAREPAEAADVARLCAGLPLALRIVAALLTADPARPLHAMAEDLKEEATRLDELTYEDRAVRAAFELSYRRLGAEEARVFRLMTACPGPDLSTETAAVAAGLDERPARRLLESLHRAHLVERGDAYGRWRMHDLVRLYAGERARDRSGPDRRDEAFDRLLGHYCARAPAAVAWLTQPEERARQNSSFASREEAVAWLDAEARVLVAAVTAAAGRGDWKRSHALAVTLPAYFEFRRLTDEWLAMAPVALDAAGRLGPRAVLAVEADLGNACRLTGRYEDSVAHLKTALDLATDERARGRILHNLGLTYLRMGLLVKAENCHRRDLRICTLAGDLRGRAHAAVALGDTLRARRRHAEAAKVLTEAVTLLQILGTRGLGHPAVLMHARTNLALTYLAGRPRSTPTYILWQLCAALATARELDDRPAQAVIFLNLSTAYANRCVVCHGPSAVEWGRRAVALAGELGDTETRARALSALGRAAGGEEGRQSMAEALALFEKLGAKRELQAARRVLADVALPPPDEHACTACMEGEADVLVRDWLDDLPHAVLRGDDGRLDEFLIPGCNVGRPG